MKAQKLIYDGEIVLISKSKIMLDRAFDHYAGIDNDTSIDCVEATESELEEWNWMIEHQ